MKKSMIAFSFVLVLSGSAYAGQICEQLERAPQQVVQQAGSVAGPVLTPVLSNGSISGIASSVDAFFGAQNIFGDLVALSGSNLGSLCRIAQRSPAVQQLTSLFGNFVQSPNGTVETEQQAPDQNQNEAPVQPEQTEQPGQNGQQPTA